ncbi:hypothetical protein BC832DRAFT_264195 [Gaertneriomyces semiglobifer]|nr:hypothetical protein BC832DRAFT_264195 [Gaertneriomyces semiglobifer]
MLTQASAQSAEQDISLETQAKDDYGIVYMNLDLWLEKIKSQDKSTRRSGFLAIRHYLTRLDGSECQLFCKVERDRGCSLLHTILNILRPGAREHANDTDAALAFDVLHGLLLFHLESKLKLGELGFAVRTPADFDGIRVRVPEFMQILASYMTSANETLVQHALETMQAAIVDSAPNIQILESKGYLEKVCHLLRNSKTAETVRHKCIELLTIYVSPDLGALPQQQGTPANNTLSKQMPASKTPAYVLRRQHLTDLVGRRFVDRLCKLIPKQN